MAGEAAQEEGYDETPQGQVRLWTTEIGAAKKELEKWHGQGVEVVKRFRDERDGTKQGDTRWNLFTSGIETKQATLYGQTPKVTVGRRFADPADDLARTAGEILERLLNTDIERDSDGYARALMYVLEDRLIPGFGQARVRYRVTMEAVPEKPAMLGPDGAELAPAVPAGEQKGEEDVDVDYVYWRDVLWSPARVWHEVRWVAFRAEMSRKELVKRFGEEIGKVVPLNAKKAGAAEDDKKPTPWGRAEVWEIWCKETKQVHWFVEGHGTLLDTKPDPYELDGFFPCPRPLIANATTTALIPRPDFVLYQDLYNEIDLVSTRITLLERAIRVVGAYDKTNTELKRMLTETGQNELIPVENWAMLQEKGGIAGAIDWFPLEQVVNALTALRDYRTELVDALYQLTGMSDIMRGQASTAGASATEQAIKAKFGSVRMQRMQDEFARFASDLQQLKKELIAKHFEPQTILDRSNAEFMPDKAMAAQAVQLIKDRHADYRIEVKPESVSLTDFAQLKQERTEVIGALAQFMTAAAPLVQQAPGSLPYLLEMMQWTVAGLRGAAQIEGVLDRAIANAQQQAQQPQAAPPPDPKLLQIQAKAQADLAKGQQDTQNALLLNQAQVAGDAQREQDQAHWNVQEAAGKAAIQAVHRQIAPAGENHPYGAKPKAGA